MVPEARVVETEHGKAVEGEGWFVLNLGEARWLSHDRAGAFCAFEPADARFAEFGINVHVLRPGEPNAKYHAEQAPECFLVLYGECLALVEEEERRLRAGDFVFCPPGTRHVFVGAGEGPCAILMVGARGGEESVLYPVTELARRHGAAAPLETSSPAEAYADWNPDFVPTRMPWPPVAG